MKFCSFRPLAGFWFLKDRVEGASLLKKEFPSPCGVLVLKKFNDFEDLFIAAGVSVPLRGSGS